MTSGVSRTDSAGDGGGDRDRLAALVLRVDRRARWRVARRTRLRFDAHHPQGLVRRDACWWITTVDPARRRGWLLVVDDDGTLTERRALGDGERFHPGGSALDPEGRCWTPVAEYRPDSTTAVWCIEPDGQAREVFRHDDHLGVVVPDGRGGLVAGTWGSRRLLRLTTDGDVLEDRPNPDHFVDFQDGQLLDAGRVALTGVARLDRPRPAPWSWPWPWHWDLGGLAVVEASTLAARHRVPVTVRSRRGHVATRNPVWLDAAGADLLVHALPDDGRGTLVTWQVTPAPGPR